MGQRTAVTEIWQIRLSTSGLSVSCSTSISFLQQQGGVSGQSVKKSEGLGKEARNQISDEIHVGPFLCVLVRYVSNRS